MDGMGWYSRLIDMGRRRTNERNGLTILHFVQQQQATTDLPTLSEKAGGQALLDRAKAFGFTGTAVKVC